MYGWLTVVVVTLVACGHAPRTDASDQPAGSGSPFEAPAGFEPRAFSVEVRGRGRPVVLIPGLGCPGAVWEETVAHLGDDYETHVLTLAGFAGEPAIKEPLSAAVRRDLTRYIRSRKLDAPIVFGHSMGGFIAYWLASYHPQLVGPIIVVDASPALSGDFEAAMELRTKWNYSDDAEFVALIRGAFMSMSTQSRRMARVVADVVRSDRRAIGDAVFEMVTTDLTDQVHAIEAPVLIIAADGRLQHRIRKQVGSIPNHQIIVLPRTRHFVMYDDPDGFYREVDRFLAAHPPNS